MERSNIHGRIATRVFVLFSVMPVVGCGPDRIHHLDCCADETWNGAPNHSSILFQLESGYAEPLRDSAALSYYLFPAELATALDSSFIVEENGMDTTWSRNIEYGPMGQMYDMLGFSAELLLIKTTCSDRDYRIQLRTFDRSHRVIDTLNYALWSNCLMRWCSGAAFEDLHIERESDAGVKERFSIGADGRFVR
jgi:hypothetical protein